MKPETREWFEVAESDLKAAHVVLSEDLFQQAVFYCQQAIEKLLKAIWTESQGAGTHPRTHNLVKLANDLGLSLTRERKNLMMDLTDQIFPSRYPEAGWRYTKKVAEEYYNSTRELFEWLRQQLI